MTKYLLLRDNKQSGPFVLDELKVKGLKAYDLVWVEGKSAAWRYPCEIEELKPFAPIVDEQPFDRFFKRSASTTTVNTPQTKNDPSGIAIVQSRPVTSVIAGESSTIPGKKIIYVTMPASRPTSPTRERESAPRELVENRQPESRPINADSRPILAEEDFTQPQQDWKTAVEITPRARKAASSRFLQPIAIVICTLVLLSAGIFIGMSINKDNWGFVRKLASRDVQSNTQPIVVDHPATSLPVSTPITSDPSPAATQPTSTTAIPGTTTGQAALNTNSATSALKPQDLTNRSSSDPALKTADPAVNKPKKQTASKDKLSNGDPKALMPSSIPAKDTGAAAMSLPVVHREATHRADISSDKDALKPNIANLVSVSANGYNVGTFGGISDLQLTVSNHSTYPLDLVVVEVQYIQANKKVFKTENLNFHNVSAGSVLMLEAPKTSRGVKVQYRITLINSKESGLSYSAI